MLSPETHALDRNWEWEEKLRRKREKNLLSHNAFFATRNEEKEKEKEAPMEEKAHVKPTMKEYSEIAESK